MRIHGGAYTDVCTTVHTHTAAHKNFPPYAHPLGDRSRPQIDRICIFKKEAEVLRCSRCKETNTHTCSFCRVGMKKKKKNIIQQMTMTQRENKWQVPTGGVTL